MNVIVIGAGLAGLTAAKVLSDAGEYVQVLEASQSIGGRVKSFTHNGYTLDRGFQVLFTGYPAVRRQLNLDALELRYVPPAAVVRRRVRHDTIADPLRDPLNLLSTVNTDALSGQDKLRVARLAAELKFKPKVDLLTGRDEPTHKFLADYGFSDEAVNNFFAPFFGGIFLNRELATSSLLFKYYFRMLMDGSIAVPKNGMGAIPQQLAEGLELSLNTRAEKLTPTANGVTVTTTNGDIEASHVIVATDPPELEKLTGAKPITEAKGSSYLYYGAHRRVDDEKRILLNASEGTVNNAHWLTNVNPAYAPVSKHLLSVTVLGNTELSDDELDKAAREDLTVWYGEDMRALQLLQVIRIPFAQYAQLPGFAADLVANTTEMPNVFIASEATSMSSIQGAMESGENAAAHILNDEKVLERPRGN